LPNYNEKIEALLKKDQLSPDEKQWLLDYLEKAGPSSELRSMLEKRFLSDIEHSIQIDAAISGRMYAGIMEGVEKKQPARLKRMGARSIAVAACVAGLLGVGIYLFFISDNKLQIAQQYHTDKAFRNDVEPGSSKAVLTLGDGSSIVLDSSSSGILSRQGNTKVIKTGGKLNYSVFDKDKKPVLFNKLTTPRGGQYQVELPDGSKVWLNAASSLRFPTAFTGRERRVEVEGEAYFEVAENKAKPFIVSTNGTEIQVLGTHFNVMAYRDETLLKTTLLEGAVKVVGNGSVILKPGQQSQLFANSRIKVVSDVNLEEVMAWKNGYFHFEGVDFETASKQLSRWYDVEVVCDRKVDDFLYAEIPRNTRLSDVLKALELTGKLKFEIKDKKIIVIL